MLIKEKLNPFKKQEIAKKLNITTRTLNNWENNRNVEKYISYIELLYILGIDPYEHIEDFKKIQKITHDI